MCCEVVHAGRLHSGIHVHPGQRSVVLLCVCLCLAVLTFVLFVCVCVVCRRVMCLLLRPCCSRPSSTGRVRPQHAHATQQQPQESAGACSASWHSRWQRWVWGQEHRACRCVVCFVLHGGTVRVCLQRQIAIHTGYEQAFFHVVCVTATNPHPTAASLFNRAAQPHMPRMHMQQTPTGPCS